MVYVSHITYLTQRTLLPDPSRAIRRLAHALVDARGWRRQQAPAGAEGGGAAATHP